MQVDVEQLEEEFNKAVIRALQAQAEALALALPLIEAYREDRRRAA